MNVATSKWIVLGLLLGLIKYSEGAFRVTSPRLHNAIIQQNAQIAKGSSPKFLCQQEQDTTGKDENGEEVDEDEDDNEYTNTNYESDSDYDDMAGWMAADKYNSRW